MTVKDLVELLSKAPQTDLVCIERDGKSIDGYVNGIEAGEGILEGFTYINVVKYIREDL